MNWRRLLTDLIQTVAPMVLGVGMMQLGTALALWLGMPALAVGGTLGGLALFGLGPLRLIRRLLFPRLDLMALFSRAQGMDAGRVWLGVCIVLAALVLALSGGVARAAGQGEVPPKARLYLPVLLAEQAAHWPEMPMRSALAAQVEQESCISLTHSRCWDPRAQLRTQREQGVGLGQITRTWRADGSPRFDSLAELRAQFPTQLSGWAWDSPTLTDPAYQLRGLILMDYRNWRVVLGTAAPVDRLAMTLAAYNGGLRGLTNDRALCAGTEGCDPARWLGHVEHTCTKSRTAAPGYRLSWCEINRGYPAHILGPRRAKYLPFTGD